MDVRIDEKGKYFTPRITKDAVTAFIRTAGKIIIGSVYVRPGNRLTDELNSDPASFLPVTDARVYSAADEAFLLQTAFLLVAFREILLIGELDALANIRATPWLEPSVEPEPLLREHDDLGVRVNEKGKYFAVRVPKDALLCAVRGGDLAVLGYLYVRPGKRLKDELNDERLRYLPMTEARVYRVSDNMLLYHASFLLVGRQGVDVVAPIDAITRASSVPWLPVQSTEESV
ncbi:MAG: hypothetical protein HXY39_20855 [Chloroflexi bacterium]|nr:hypothetical protein [Chloroflexota bacterium]